MSPVRSGAAARRVCFALPVLPAILGAHAAFGALPLDPSFGGAGSAGVPVSEASATALVLQPDGKLIVAGNVLPTEGILLARLKPNGSLDSTFADGGFAVRFGTSSLSAAAAALQTDGRILVAGTQFLGSSSYSFFLARFLPNGDADPSFGVGGLATAQFPGLVSGASSLAVQADGRVLVAGYAGTSVPPTADFAVARFDPSGNPDSAFGVGGQAVIDVGGAGWPEGASGVVVEEGGRIVLGGTAAASGGFVLVGLRPDGSLDPAFGTAGRAQFDFGFGSQCGALTLQRDGKIVAAGNGGEDIVAVRLSANGVADPSFGAGGVARIHAPRIPVAVAVDGLGRIVIAAQGDFALARFLPNGEPDRTLGVDGWQTTDLDIGGNFHARVNALAVQPDGRIILGGDQTYVSATFVTLFRYLDSVRAVPAVSDAGLAALAVLLAAAGAFALRRVA